MTAMPTPSAVRICCAALLILIQLPSARAYAEEATGTIGYAQERFKKPPPYRGPPRTGRQVYDASCKTCHARTTQGAPLPDDAVEWGMRVQKGLDVLMDHVRDGYKELMPVRGGCGSCTDAELRAGILYILEQSSIIIPDQTRLRPRDHTE